MLGNLVLENCNAPGTGALTPAGAPAGRQTIVGTFGAGAKFFYGVTDGTQTEEGWSVAGTTLTRNVIWNTAGTTSPLNFTGACTIYGTLPAQRALWADDANVIQAQNRRFANLAAATLAGDAARFDQMAWQRLTPDVLPSGSAGVIGFSLAGCRKYRIEWADLGASWAGAGVLYAQMSANGGGTYDNAQHYWFGVSVRVGGGSETYSTSTTSTQVPLTNGQSGAQVHNGFLEFSSSSGRGRIDNVAAATSVAQVQGLFEYTQGNANSVILGLTAGNFDSGAVRMLGWKPL